MNDATLDTPQRPIPTIIIEMTPEGLSVKGTSMALANPVLAFGMLEAAKDVIRRGNEERNKSRIEVAQMVPPPGLSL